MYETGSGLKPYLPKGETPYPEEGIPTLQPFPPHVSKTCSLLSFAISSPLPCFHNFPSCLHPVCKPFYENVKKRFSFFLSHLRLVSSFETSKAESSKSSMSCVETQPVTSHLVQIHIQNHFAFLHISVVYWTAACLYTWGDSVFLINSEGLYCFFCWWSIKTTIQIICVFCNAW